MREREREREKKKKGGGEPEQNKKYNVATGSSYTLFFFCMCDIFSGEGVCTRCNVQVHVGGSEQAVALCAHGQVKKKSGKLIWVLTSKW